MSNESVDVFVDITKIDSYAELQNCVHRKRLDQPLKTTDVIIIHGKVHADCERFSINLICGPGPTSSENGDNIALHVNPRFEQRYVVRNHRVGGKWGVEDTAGKQAFNLKRGEEFEISIFVADTEFLISINGEHYCTFPFRIHAKKISSIEVHGAIIIDNVQIQEMNFYPSTNTPDAVPLLELNNPLNEDIKLPYCCRLSKGFTTSQQIQIEAIVKLLPVAFHVNLQSDNHVWPHPLIPLHINVRFVQKAEIYIVRNSWQNGQWGSEERAVTQHFQPGRAFMLSILCESDSYTVWVNHSLIAHYNYQMSCDLASHLYIEGDIKVKRIEYTDQANMSRFNYTQPYNNALEFDTEIGDDVVSLY